MQLKEEYELLGSFPNSSFVSLGLKIIKSVHLNYINVFLRNMKKILSKKSKYDSILFEKYIRRNGKK